MRGRIVGYLEEKGYGFIVDENKESRFFHVSEVNLDSKIQVGSVVEFVPDSSSKGKIANDIKVSQNTVKQFIDLGETRVKINNIKNYGLTKETIDEKYIHTRKRSTVENVLFKTLTVIDIAGNLMGANLYNEVTDEHLDQLFSDSDRCVKVEKVTYDVLYITTYQGDNFRFSSRSTKFDIKKKAEELDNYCNI